ncbi:MAG TPA: SLC13 family permease [Pirellulaceae bacterium]|nr:SLC13 family permease [Pirellulaceae bacterium]
MVILEPLFPWIAIATAVVVFLGLQTGRGVPTDLLFILGAAFVTAVGIITPEEAFRGLANPAVVTIGALLVVAEGLRRTGVLDWVGRQLLGSIQTERGALVRLLAALVTTSSFMLNTAVVAMMAPVVVDWCRRRRISPSRLLLPVSYLAILGGTCTLVGTSTTLVANAILDSEFQQRQLEDASLAGDPTVDPQELARHRRFTAASSPMTLFEIGRVGLPCALVGSAFLFLFAPRLLPNRTDMIEQLGEQRREYLLEMQVQPVCSLIGKSVELAGLRHLPGLFLIEIDREGEVLTPVSPHERIHAGDRLVFTGVVSTIVDLEKIPGLVPAADSTFEFHPTERHQRRLTEAVLSRTSPLIGTTVREANFRRLYNAAVVAVHRNGVRLTNKIGNIQLEPGDTLLLQTRDEFVAAYRNSRDFYLVSSVEGWQPRLHHKAKIAAGLAISLVVWLVVGMWPGMEKLVGNLGSPALAATTIAALMVACGCLRVADARGSIDMRVILTIAGALGLGQALQSSGAANMIATAMVGWVGDHPHLLLIVVYMLTVLLTEAISNNAVAAMLVPLAIAVAWESGYNPRPFIMAITLAASLSFVTPIGYQTNLMVMGPGGYRPVDYVRCGTPLAIAIGITALLLIPRVWPF